MALGLLGSVGVRAETAGHGAQAGKGVAAVVGDAAREQICATCRFWGGTRRVSEEKKTVYAESLGWCNNPESQRYQTMTTPESGPMQAWRKWEAI